MLLTQEQLRDLYRRRARSYDFSANLYYLIGFREAYYRKRAVAALGLKPGDTVVEIGCGTGLNFIYLHDQVGDTGRIIGVDLTDAMLRQARKRVNAHHWHNVELIQADAAQYRFPTQVRAVISSFALTLVPEYEKVIANAAKALGEQGRMVILDLKKSERWPLWLVKLGVWITKPFGVSLKLTERHPWEVMKNYFSDVRVEEIYGGFVYIATGKKQ